jgi:hypothetical protein
MWQSMQFVTAGGGIFENVGHAEAWWHVRHFAEYDAASRSGSCKLWQVEQVMFADD